jgi:hypothetical protein
MLKSQGWPFWEYAESPPVFFRTHGIQLLSRWHRTQARCRRRFDCQGVRHACVLHNWTRYKDRIQSQSVDCKRCSLCNGCIVCKLQLQVSYIYIYQWDSRNVLRSGPSVCGSFGLTGLLCTSDSSPWMERRRALNWGFVGPTVVACEDHGMFKRQWII